MIIISSKKLHIYLLSTYTNKEHLEETRYETEHESKVEYCEDSVKIKLSEINSLVEERYCLSLSSAKYIIEGTMPYTEVKEAMIHHHPQGHPWKHLQFKLIGKNEVIRIKLDTIDEEDYIKCIKGFINIAQNIILLEQKENRVQIDLQRYFFNEDVKKLEPERAYLLGKIKQAYERGAIINNDDEGVDSRQLEELRNENHLLPFLEFE